MIRIVIVGLLIALCVQLSGCGGSSGSGPITFIVNIQPTRATPKNTTTSAGNTVQFINQALRPIQVMSGTLDPLGNPLVVHLIVINNTGFSPTNSEANLGDTVRFSNASMNTFFLNIVNDDGAVVSNLTISQGMEQDFHFPYAGQFTIRNQNNSLFVGTITVFGRPNPSHVFSSSVLAMGGVFSVKFPSAGTTPFFVQEQDNPDRSFIIGSVAVQ